MMSVAYSEINQTVPCATYSPVPEVYGECQVPSPSQWSDHCRSPQSLHSPSHVPADLEKLKEEPYHATSPQQYQLLLPPQSVPLQSPVYASQTSIKQEVVEHSFNLAELLAAGAPQTLQQQQQQQQIHQLQRQQEQVFKASFNGPFYCGLQGVAEKPGQLSNEISGEEFLDSLVRLKREEEEDVSVGPPCSVLQLPQLCREDDVSVGPPCSVLQLPQLCREEDVSVGPPCSVLQLCREEDVSVGPPCSVLQLPQLCREFVLDIGRIATDHCRTDMQRVAEALNIPCDPAQWSVSSVRAWFALQVKELQGHPLRLEELNLTGSQLLQLTEADFRRMFPEGEYLYWKLVIWREVLRGACDSQQQQHQLHTRPLVLSTLLGHHQQPQQKPASAPLTHPVAPAAASPHASTTCAAQMNASPCPPVSPVPQSHSAPQLQVPVAFVRQEPPQQNQQQPILQQQLVQQQPSPPPQQQSPGIFMEEACLDVASLLRCSPKPSVGTRDSTAEPLDSEDEAEEENNSGSGTGRGGTHIHLWQFLKDLLTQPQQHGSSIRWLDRPKGVFKIEDSVRVARLWGRRKNRPAMNYDKLSRSIRQYYKKGIMKKTERSQRLVYQFCHPYCL